MIDFKLLLLTIISIQSILASEYGLRFRTEALARSKIDDRIVAILNSGKQLPRFSENYRFRGISHSQNNEENINEFNKKYGWDGWESPNYKEQVPIIEVNASEMPIDIIFNTNSPKINVQQRHKPGIAPKVESTRSEEEPQRLRHEVYRPVIQELREIIQPYRQIVQQIEPVIQEVQQIISSAQPTPKQNDRTLSSIFSQKMQNSRTGSQSDIDYFSKFRTIVPKMTQKLISSDKPKMIASAMRTRKLGDILEAPLLTDPLVSGTDSHTSYSVHQSYNKSENNNKNQLQKKYMDLGGALNRKFKEQTPPQLLGLEIKPRADVIPLGSAQQKLNTDYKLLSNNRIEDKFELINKFFDYFSKFYDLDMSPNRILRAHTLSYNSAVN